MRGRWRVDSELGGAGETAREEMGFGSMVWFMIDLEGPEGVRAEREAQEDILRWIVSRERVVGKCSDRCMKCPEAGVSTVRTRGNLGK